MEEEIYEIEEESEEIGDEEEKPITAEKEHIVSILDEYFYHFSMDKLVNKPNTIEDIKGTMEFAYKNKKQILHEKFNEFYHLMETSFFVTYLTLIYYIKSKNIYIPENFQEKEEINFKNYNVNVPRKKGINKINDSIFDFILSYEEKSLYINFINSEGYKSHIKKRYDELYSKYIGKVKFYRDDYKSYCELRDFLIKNHNYEVSTNRKIKILLKEIQFSRREKIDDDIIKEFKYLKNTYNDNLPFFRGEKEREIKEILKEVDLYNKDKIKRNKYINSYASNLMSIISS